MMKEYVIEINSRYNYPVYDILENGIGSTGKRRADYENGKFRFISEKEYPAYYEAHMDGLCGKWEEISEERYDDMLDTLSPIDWKQGGFFLGELYTGDVAYFFQRADGKFYESKQRTSYPREKIMESLMEYINGTGKTEQKRIG